MGCGFSTRRHSNEQAYAPDDGHTGQRPLPPLSPPRHSKAQLIPDPAVFKQQDRSVSNTPRPFSGSLEDFASHLTSKGSTDLEKVRAIFCWIAYNITYDTASHGADTNAPQDAHSVLRTRKAVCLGFSRLFEALSTAANLPCLVVTGINKEQDHDPETVYTASSKSNHAWNLVFVRGEWRPLDNTFGAGHIDRTGKFTRNFDEHWFLTDPVEFVPGHFPLVNGNVKGSEQYQLLKRPVSIEHFSAGVEPTSLAFTVGLQCLTHRHTVIEVKRDVTIKVKATRQPLESVNVTLVERNSQGGSKDSSNVLTSLSGDGTCTIYVRPPRVATYVLKIMGRARAQDDTHTLHLLLSYVIKCKETHGTQEPFPEKSGAWGLCNPAAAECGLRKSQKTPLPFNAHNGRVQVPLSLSRPTELKAELRHARAIEEDLSQYTFLRYTEGGATVCSRLPKPGYYRLRVFAGQLNETSLKQVADYLLFTDRGCPDQEPFPGKSNVVGLKLPVATECGLQRVKNATAIFHAKKGTVRVSVPLSRHTELKVQLKHARAVQEDLCRYAFLQYTRDGAMISARLPKPGYYRLRVFANHPNEGKLLQAADFLLFADKGCADQEPLPEKSGVWGFQKPDAIKCGFKRVRNAKVRFTAKDGQVHVPLSLIGHVQLKAHLKHARSMQEDLGHFLFLEYTHDGAMIHARLPKPGYYMLRVFASDPKETNMSHVADFLLSAEKGCGDLEPFPDKSGVIGLKIPVAVDCGLRQNRNAGVLFNAQNGEVQVPVSLSRFTEIKAQLNHASSMQEDLAHFTFIEYTKGRAIIRARLPKPGYYRLRVFADNSKEDMHLVHAADFLLSADQGRADCKPFPKACKLAHQQQVKLLQPLNGQLPRDVSTLFRIRAPGLGVVKIGDMMMEKKNDGVWEAKVTPSKGQHGVIVYAAEDEKAVSVAGVYQFTVV